MSKQFLAVLAAVIILAAGCRRGRSVSKVDVPPLPAATVESVSEALQKNQVQYEWLRLKTGVTYEDPDNSYSASAFLKLKKDSLIWGSVSMLIELVRAQVTPDSATLLNRATRQYSSFPVSGLQQMLAVEGLDLSSLQRLLLAQPPFGMNRNSRLTLAEEDYIIEYTASTFKEQMQIVPAATHLLRYRYERNFNEYLEVNYSDFTEVEGKKLPGKIDMHIMQGPRKMRITLDVSDYTFLDTDEAPFSIPSSYQRAQ